MNFFNRAIKNITRRLSRTILLVIAFFLIGNFVIVGLGIASATENAKVLTRQKMRAVVSYGVDYDKVWRYVDSLTDEDEIAAFYENYPTPKLKDVKELLKDERVATANALTNNMIYATPGLDFVHLNNRAEENMGNGNGGVIEYLDDGTSIERVYYEPYFFVKANYFPNMIEFVDGGYEISQGRFYTQDEIDRAAEVVLISNALANQNNLRIGDRISVYINSPNDLEYMEDSNITLEDITAEYEIIGLYEPGDHINPDSSSFDYTYPYENPDNMLLMPATTLYNSSLVVSQKMWDYYASQYPDNEYYQNIENRPSPEALDETTTYDVTFLLNDPLDVDQFVADYQESVGEFCTLDANNDEFNRLSKPLDTLNLYATFIIWLVVINAIVIITLVTALTLKTREYEIGVLLSIGASKFKVISQFFVELALVAIIGFSLSVISGSLIANQVGTKVLEYQIASSDVANEDDYDYYVYNSIWDTDYSSDVKLDDLISEYNVSISPLIIGEIYVLGLGLVLISILIPALMIMRFNPKKILMNQN